MSSHRPPYEFGGRHTKGALGSFFLFVVIVLFLYFIFGGFESW